MEKEFWLILIGGISLFFRDLASKIAWSFVHYMARGEFNDDKNEATPDRFILLNRSTGSFTECWIINYSIFNVGWGFFIKKESFKESSSVNWEELEGFVYKKTNWLSWVASSNDRFPAPIKFSMDSREELFEILKKR